MSRAKAIHDWEIAFACTVVLMGGPLLFRTLTGHARVTWSYVIFLGTWNFPVSLVHSVLIRHWEWVDIDNFRFGFVLTFAFYTAIFWLLILVGRNLFRRRMSSASC